jgi:uncharacterized protein
VRRFFKAAKAGVAAALSGPDGEAYAMAGRKVRCTHCGGDRFYKSEAQLNTSGMTLFNLDWMNRSGTALICQECSLIQWFYTAPERL